MKMMNMMTPITTPTINPTCVSSFDSSQRLPL